MAERVMVTCDECGAAPAEPVGIRVKSKNYQKDLCATHVGALLKGTRAPRRGRPRKVEASTASAAPAAPAAPKRRGRPPKVAVTA